MIRKLDKKSEHQKYYSGSGGILPGCSSIAKIAEETGGLIHWAWQKGAAGEDYRSERDDAADAGSIGHWLASAYLLGAEADLSDFTAEAQDLGRKAFEKFREWWEKGDYTFLHSELQLVSEKHLFGGTLDILARSPEDKICLIDLKATKSLRASHSVQAGGYSILVNENHPDEPVDEICLLRLPKDGKKVEPLWLDPLNFPFYQKAFLANLSCYYARKELEQVLPPQLKA